MDTGPDFLIFSEVSAGHLLADDLFRRKFGQAPPTDDYHLVVFSLRPDLRVISYAHFLPFGDICLVGGVCTDGNVVRRLPDDCKAWVNENGGIYFHLLKFGFERYASSFKAFFGYCGDERALSVNLRAGFRATPHEKLIIYTPNPLHERVEAALIASAHALGPF